MVDVSPTAKVCVGGEVTQPSISLFLLQLLELADVIPGHGLLSLCLFAPLGEVYATLIALYLSRWRSTWVRFLWYWGGLQAILSRIPVFLHVISRKICMKAHTLQVLKCVRWTASAQSVHTLYRCFSGFWYIVRSRILTWATNCVGNLMQVFKVFSLCLGKTSGWKERRMYLRKSERRAGLFLRYILFSAFWKLTCFINKMLK